MVESQEDDGTLYVFTQFVEYNKVFISAKGVQYPGSQTRRVPEEIPEPDPIPEVVFTSDQVNVDYYVPRCKDQIFSVEIWEELTDDELYYILNGIYAFEGRYFEGDYYDAFSWYERRVMLEDFTDDMLNYNQHKNIANIDLLLKQRGVR